MTDANLTSQEEQQLRDVIAEAPDSIRDGFCRCWPAVKNLLEWLIGKNIPGVLKLVLGGDAQGRRVDLQGTRLPTGGDTGLTRVGMKSGAGASAGGGGAVTE